VHKCYRQRHWRVQGLVFAKVVTEVGNCRFRVMRDPKGKPTCPNAFWMFRAAPSFSEDRIFSMVGWMVGFLRIYLKTIVNTGFMGDTASARLAFHAVS
jgi:hypothetical protein